MLFQQTTTQLVAFDNTHLSPTPAGQEVRLKRVLCSGSHRAEISVNLIGGSRSSKNSLAAAEFNWLHLWSQRPFSCWLQARDRSQQFEGHRRVLPHACLLPQHACSSPQGRQENICFCSVCLLRTHVIRSDHPDRLPFNELRIK